METKSSSSSSLFTPAPRGAASVATVAAAAPTLEEKAALASFVGVSDASQRLLAQIRQLAPLSVTVLLCGATGSGKTTVARLLHLLGARARAPFVSFNCANFPAELVEDELFGHDRGAFTGATATKHGLFEAANGGTLFLDEITEMPRALQAKLLHVIESHSFTRLGSRQVRHVNVRLVCATNGDLSNLRPDLRYRIDEARIDVPSLADRRSDVELLLHYYFGLMKQKIKSTESFALAPDARAALCAYSWPGNIRELGNVVLKLLLDAAARQSTLIVLDMVCAVLPFDPHPLTTSRPPPADEVLPAAAAVASPVIPSRCQGMTAFDMLRSIEFAPYLGEVPFDHYVSRLLLHQYAVLTAGGLNHSQIARALSIERTLLYSRLRNARKLSAAPIKSTAAEFVRPV